MEGHNPNTLAWWRWNLRKRRREARGIVRLAEVVVDDGDPRELEGNGLHVRVGGADILVQPATDLALLRRVVEVLS